VTVEKLAVARARAMLEHRPPATMDSIEWSSEDFVHIAREQAAREEDAARRGGPILICDTDAFATGVWHQRYTGRRSPEVEAIGAPAPYHLYLLTHPDDVPFVQDGIRDGEHVRRRMTDDFARRLDETGRRWTWLRAGDDPMGAIDRALGEGHRLSDPIGDRRS
jgi:HTH-type transcriptional repressor of NAD biosynthesis genes